MALILAHCVLLHQQRVVDEIWAEGASYTFNTMCTIIFDAIPPQDDGVPTDEEGDPGEGVVRAGIACECGSRP
jgi:hypothetical protein